MTERQGIEIDYCPTCRGVWLDRGELDKLIGNTPVQQSAPRRDERPMHDTQQYSTDRHSQPYPHKPHKKESFLGELFDF